MVTTGKSHSVVLGCSPSGCGLFFEPVTNIYGMFLPYIEYMGPGIKRKKW